MLGLPCNTRQNTLSTLSLLALLALGGCAPNDKPSPPPEAPLQHTAFDRANAWAEMLSFVGLGPRDATTPGAKRAAEHLHARLDAIGLTPHIDAFSDLTPSGTQTFYNVYAAVEGTGNGQIILMSHSDTKRGISDQFAGANDSGSSTGVLLELARLAAAHPSPLSASLLFAFVDGEECEQQYGPHDGLHGSRRLLERLTVEGKLSNIKAVILLDMIGDKDLNISIPANCDRELTRQVLRAAHQTGHRARFSTMRGQVIDDHLPFHEAGIPAVNLIDFQYGSAPGKNDYWHTAQDTPDKLSPESMGIAGSVVIELLNVLLLEQ